MDNMTVRIECEGSITLDLDSLLDLQGNLKDLTEEKYVKLRNSIVEEGFSFPIFFWLDNDGKYWILDAHQRKRTLTKMRSEGWTIPPLPAVSIHARDKAHAKKKLLLLNSQYGKITLDGYEEFIHEEGAEVNEDELEDMIAIPDLEVWDDKKDSDTTDSTTNSTEAVKNVKCPNCQAVFEAKDNLVD